MTVDGFFARQTPQSRIKAEIVSQYFDSWANVMLNVCKRSGKDRIAYVDLFAGRGLYKDGSPSTPLLVLQKAIAKPELRTMLMTLFNDRDARVCAQLKTNIAKLQGIETLKHAPSVLNETVGDAIVQQFQRMTLIPTLLFVDPWGYKGLSLDLLASVLKDFGCDCIFFFNYRRVNMHLVNEAQREPIEGLFGRAPADRLRRDVRSLNPKEREQRIIGEVKQAIRGKGAPYMVSLSFKDSSGKRSSHYVVLVSKHALAYDIMKEIMAKKATDWDDETASFSYSERDTAEPLLFDTSRWLDDLAESSLAEELLNHLAGQRMTVGDVYKQHNIDRPYLERHYKKVLRALEAAGGVRVEASAGKRRRQGTMADHLAITFPVRGA